jgi:hypothetical protein
VQLDSKQILEAINRFEKKDLKLAVIDEAIANVREDIAGEAVLDFGAWLTVRSEVSGPFGSNNATCGDMALLVAEFNKMRGYTVSQQRPAEIEEGRKDKE